MTAEPTAVAMSLEFVRALDDAKLDERTARLRELVTADATWWIDTGKDRLAGRRGYDPGPDRPWPLHGTMPMAEKLDLVSRIGLEIFPQGLGRRIISRAFGNQHVALVEAQGDSMHVSGKAYRNRYAFVIDVDVAGVRSVREYLDTLHAQDVFGGDPVTVRSVAPRLKVGVPVEPGNEPERLALALWPALADGDIEAFGALFAPDGTWWTDTGTDRDRGAFDGSGGPANGWPLHGVIPITAKLDYMQSRMAAGYAGASVVVTPVRIFSEGELVALEAESYAELSSGLIYQNRYVFVIETHASKIRQVREYCDTLHVIDVTGVKKRAKG